MKALPGESNAAHSCAAAIPTESWSKRKIQDSYPSKNSSDFLISLFALCAPDFTDTTGQVPFVTVAYAKQSISPSVITILLPLVFQRC